MGENRFRTCAALLVVVALLVAACGSDDSDDSDGAATTAESADTTESGATSDTDESTAPSGDDLESIGLWNDGSCDSSLDPLQVGIQVVFESPVLTLVDQAEALEASATAFNTRGGANGHCIEVTTCDDKADPNQALECVRTLDDAGVAVTINDTTPVATADVGAGYAAAGIPRFAISPGQEDYPDLNSYPFDAGGTGTSIMMPQALLNEGITKVAIVRVDVPSATALAGFYESIFTDNGLEIVADLPVAAGTTDYSQFIIAARDAGAEALVLPIGGQEGIQVLQAAQQLDADLIYSSSLGTFPLADIAALGDYGERVILNAAIPPAGADLPIVDQLVADLEASGIDELQRANLKSSPMRSWVGLYALLQIIRESGTEDFSRENLKELIEASGPIDMGDLMGPWTPATDHEGAFTRAGQGTYQFWSYDNASESFVFKSDADWDETLCDSAVGAPCE